jgi:hypothetical protein
MEEAETRVLLSQYEKMMSLGTHYDQKLWLIPSSAYAILGIFYNFIFSSHEPFISFLLSIISSFIFSGFLLQFLKDRSFQLGNQHALNNIKQKLKMVETSEFSGEQPSDLKDRWFIKRIRKQSVFNIMFYLMLITWACQIIVTLILLYRFIASHAPVVLLLLKIFFDGIYD